MVVAQALGEYAAVSVLMNAFSDFWLQINDYVSTVELSTWLIVGGIGLFLAYLWSASS